jgi:DNA-binding transcriptional LysR family regulator
VNDQYILVNWGTSFAIHHAQNFPDMTPPKIHVHLGRLAYSHIKECGGSAYLAESMVQDDIKNQRLFVVPDAPVIKRMCYAAYSAHSDRLQDIEKAIKPLFDSSQ